MGKWGSIHNASRDSRQFQEIVSDSVPFSQYSLDAAVLGAIITRGERPNRPDSLLESDKMWRLWKSAWTTKPEERPSIRSVLATMRTLLRPQE